MKRPARRGRCSCRRFSLYRRQRHCLPSPSCSPAAQAMPNPAPHCCAQSFNIIDFVKPMGDTLTKNHPEASGRSRQHRAGCRQRRPAHSAATTLQVRKARVVGMFAGAATLTQRSLVASYLLSEEGGRGRSDAGQPQTQEPTLGPSCCQQLREQHLRHQYDSWRHATPRSRPPPTLPPILTARRPRCSGQIACRRPPTGYPQPMPRRRTHGPCAWEPWASRHSCEARTPPLRVVG